MKNPSKTDREWLQQVLTRDIPLGQSMGVEVARLDHSGITIRAPLEPNINDKGTGFGGSLCALMILAGWSLLRLTLRAEDRAADLVITRAESRFLAPVTGPMEARCAWPEEPDRARFLSTLDSRGRSRLALTPRLFQGEVLAAELEARYAALTGSARSAPARMEAS